MTKLLSLLLRSKAMLRRLATTFCLITCWLSLNIVICTLPVTSTYVAPACLCYGTNCVVDVAVARKAVWALLLLNPVVSLVARVLSPVTPLRRTVIGLVELLSWCTRLTSISVALGPALYELAWTLYLPGVCELHLHANLLNPVIKVVVVGLLSVCRALRTLAMGFLNVVAIIGDDWVTCFTLYTVHDGPVELMLLNLSTKTLNPLNLLTRVSNGLNIDGFAMSRAAVG